MAIASELVKKGACGTWRYKLTVNVDTPEGLKSGSAVREVEVCLVDHLVPEVADADVKVRGEAVVVDLGKRGVLFAIMDTDGSYQIVFEAFPGAYGLTKEGIDYYSKLKASKIITDPKKYPEYAQLITFSDLKNPLTVMAIHPEKPDNILGYGVKIKDIAIEMTDKPVTWKINQWLPWLVKNNGGYLDGQFAGGGPELSNILHGGNFRRGQKND